MKKPRRIYSEMLKSELLAMAQRLGLTNLSRLRKDEIVDLIKRAQRRKARAAAARKPGLKKTTRKVASKKAATKKAATKTTATTAKKAATTAKKAATKKTATTAKKAATKKVTAKTTATKKAATKTTASKTTATKKAATKTTATKTTATKTTATKTTATKTTATKKATAKKATATPPRKTVRTASKKVAAKKTTPRKTVRTATKKAAVKKVAATKTATTKQPPGKAPARKTSRTTAAAATSRKTIRSVSGKKASTKKAASPAASQDSVRRSHGEETSEEVPGQTAAQASKYSAMTSYRPEELQGIDEQLPSLPDNYGENRIVLLPRDPSWLFAYWNLTEEYKEAARAAGGKNLAIRLYDVSGIDFDSYGTQVTYEHECTEWARSWYLPMPLAGREYIVEIGYRGGVDWYPLARSTRVFAPQEQPASAGSEFTTIPFDEELRHARHRLPRTEGPQSPLAAGSPQTLFDDGAFRIVMNATPGTPSGAPNVPLFSKVMLGAGEGFPGSLGQMPGSLGQMPGSLGQLPGSLGQMPGSLGQMPGSLGQMPGSLEQPGHLPGSVGLAGMDATFAMTQVSPGAGGQLVQGQVSAPVVLEEANQPMLQASIEIVISGRSFPNTDLTIADQVIPVGPDGGFSLRVSIPEGLREIPITAKSRSTSEVRSIKLWFGSQCE